MYGYEQTLMLTYTCDKNFSCFQDQYNLIMVIVRGVYSIVVGFEIVLVLLVILVFFYDVLFFIFQHVVCVGRGVDENNNSYDWTMISQLHLIYIRTVYCDRY